jgi:hypothetical protein
MNYRAAASTPPLACWLLFKANIVGIVNYTQREVGVESWSGYPRFR